MAENCWERGGVKDWSELVAGGRSGRVQHRRSSPGRCLAAQRMEPGSLALHSHHRSWSWPKHLPV